MPFTQSSAKPVHFIEPFNLNSLPGTRQKHDANVISSSLQESRRSYYKIKIGNPLWHYAQHAGKILVTSSRELHQQQHITNTWRKSVRTFFHCRYFRTCSSLIDKILRTDTEINSITDKTQLITWIFFKRKNDNIFWLSSIKRTFHANTLCIFMILKIARSRGQQRVCTN